MRRGSSPALNLPSGVCPLTNNLVLRFRSPDRPGIVAAVAPLLAAQGCDICAAEVYGDPDTGRFFCRMELTSPLNLESLVPTIAPTAEQFRLDWTSRISRESSAC